MSRYSIPGLMLLGSICGIIGYAGIGPMLVPPPAAIPGPHVVGHPFKIYIKGPLVLSRDFTREAGGRLVAEGCDIQSVTIERKEDDGEIIFSARSEPGIAFFSYLNVDCNGVLVIELGDDQEAAEETDERPDPDMAPYGTFTRTIIPRMADDPIWEAFSPDATTCDLDESGGEIPGVKYPARFVKVWPEDLAKIAELVQASGPNPTTKGN